MRRSALGLATMLAALSLGLVVGCDAFREREGIVVLTGVGSGASVGQSVPAGRYGATWSIAADDRPDTLCWFELSLASPAGDLYPLAQLTATTGGTTGSGDVELLEPTVLSTQVRATDCGAWGVTLVPLPDRDPAAP